MKEKINYFYKQVIYNWDGVLTKDSSEMFIYIWYNKNTPNQCKMGEHFVNPNTEILKSVYKRISSSFNQSSEKVDWNNGDIVIYAIYNITDLAIRLNRLKAHGGVDTFIREDEQNCRRTRLKDTEHHTISPQEMCDILNEYLVKSKQPLSNAKLPSEPYYVACEVIKSLRSGDSKIAAELPPRFWKTMTEGVISVEMKWDLTIIATYEKTVFVSFKDMLKQHQQFSDIEIVDCDDKNYKTNINHCIQNGKKVIALLSLRQGSYREDRCKFLYSKSVKRGTFVEEADLGSWKKLQVDVLKKYQSKNEVVILTTGTNIDRATALWKLDFITYRTYVDLLLRKKEAMSGIGLITIAELNLLNLKPLEYFARDTNLDKYYVDIIGLKMNAYDAVEEVKKNPKYKNFDLLDWNDYSKKPIKYKEFLNSLLDGIYYGKGANGKLNIFEQLDNIDTIPKRNGRFTHMFWFPHGTKKSNQTEIYQQFKDKFNNDNYEIILLSGADKVTSAKAEKMVSDALLNNPNKNIIILGFIIGSRSFSIGEITVNFICFENGSFGTYKQKAWRVGTSDSNNPNKVGVIVSLSFDPERDDKFDTDIIKTADRLFHNKGGTYPEHIKAATNAFPIYLCSEIGALKIEADCFFDEAMSRGSFYRTIINQIDIINLDSDLREKLLASKISKTNGLSKVSVNNDDIEDVDIDDECLDIKIKNKSKNSSINDDNNKLKLKLEEILKNLEYLIRVGKLYGAVGILDSFSKFEKSKDSKKLIKGISETFDFDYVDIKKLIVNGNITAKSIDSINHKIIMK
jgi:hypothetical protein